MSTSMNTSKEHSTDTASTLLQASQPPLDTQEHKPKAQAAESGSDLLIPDKNIEPRQQRTPSLTPEPASRPSEEQSNISTSTAPPPLQALQPPLDTHNDQLRARGAESDSPLFVTDSETKPRQQLATSQAPEPSSGPSKSDETISQPVAPMTQASQASHKSANLKVDDSIKRKRMKKAERRRKLAARTSDDLEDGEAMEVDVDLPPVPESSEHREHYRSMHTQAYGYVLAFVRDEEAGARLQIDKINQDILDYNNRAQLPKEHLTDGIIGHEDLKHVIDDILTARAKVDEDPDDQTRVEALGAATATLDKLSKDRAYPESWTELLRECGGKGGKDTAQAAVADPLTKLWTWATGTSKDGKRIMAWRPCGSGTRCVVEETAGCPVWTIKSGSEVGLRQVEQYKQVPRTLQLAGTGVEKRKWSYKDRGKYESLLAVTSPEYKTHNGTNSPRTPETHCWIIWSNELHHLTRSDLCRVLGKESANNDINTLCKKHGKPTLHEIQPQTSLRPGVDSSQLKVAKPDSRSIEDRFLRLEQKIQEQHSRFDQSFLSTKDEISKFISSLEDTSG
ncbi:hypothetical protein EJ05DRAFT_526831 [Pseudovirgaria hyperparasitica]|uniref:Uncharacterized protein n=1 Tax=Pseudovirgaria hyperparasitica TaxID=470096 RepID=A0A6A6VSB0_9PEZI|nr:uncharacterized protein EJ05DRAFT_526831 [Pseudovirgaria hyperparasitica]KAF2752480.1 hypothetical protein EJ05DRAFT_526831 [Pseudovirgaria hyperparasitica]